MKTITVPFLSLDHPRQDTLPVHHISNEPWPAGTDLSCEAAFSISHFDKGLCIKYAVTEPFLHVKKRKPNDDVHKDNCVEIFIAFHEEKGYYNFEFNCLGSMKGGFGESREDRVFLQPDLLKKIGDSAAISLDNTGAGNRIRWTLTVVIPVSAFTHHQVSSLSGLSCSANFTKCGDDLPNPHFLSWTNITSPTPDFHQPSFFGKLIFEPNDSIL